MTQCTITACFDWFSVSADYEPADLVATFVRDLAVEPRTVRPLNGYQRAVGLFRGDDEELRVQWSNSGRPNILAHGFPSQRVYEITAAKFPEYSVARVDVAIDFDDAELFEVAHAAMRRLSHERGIKHHLRGDWETPGSPDGRTTYAGALGKSAVIRRLYEFAKCHGYGLPVRFEIELKPPSRQKAHYAGLGPVDIVKADGYSVELLRRLGFGVDRLRIGRVQQPQGSAWFLHLVRQYGPKLSEYIARELEGDAARLGPAITAAYEAELEHRRRLTRAAVANSNWTALTHGDQGLAT